ncbi:MAG: serine hydrolase domain-containing protein [bacterium]
MHKRPPILTLGLLLAMGPYCLSAYGNHPAEHLFKLLSDSDQPVESLVKELRQKYDVTGLSVGIYNRHGLLWARGYGYADKEAERVATAHTVYRVGSLSKPVTAAAILRMEDSGVLDIDQPIEMYLDRFHVKSRFSSIAPVTARNLLTHHSGLPTDINKGLWTDIDFTTVIEQLRSEYTSYPADYVHSYSNVGYSVLGCLIEELSQQHYDRYIEDALFRPLGMRYSSFDPADLPDSLLSKGYANGKAQTLLPMRDKPAMGLYSNVLDLGRFAAMMLREGRNSSYRVLEPATTREMMDRQNDHVALDFDFEIGLGFFLNRTSTRTGVRTLEHGGSTMNYGAYMLISPEADLGIVVLANSKGSRKVARTLSRKLFDLIVTGNIASLDHSREPEKFSPVTHNEDPRTGRYITRAGLISISTEEDRLCACSQKKTLDLIPMPDGWFGIYNADAEKTLRPPPVKISRQIVNGENVIVMEKDGKQTRYGALMPDDPVPEIWKLRLGKFEIINEDPGYPVTDVRLLELDDQLFLRYRMPKLTAAAMQIPLRPISTTEAITVGLGQTRGETLRILDVDHKEHILFSGYLFKPVQ